MVRPRLAALTGAVLLLTGAVTTVSQAATSGLSLAVETGTSPRRDVNVHRLNLLSPWAFEGRMRARYATPNGHRSENQASVRAVVRMLAPTRRRWFFEAGTGPVYLSDPEIGQLDLGQHLQFRSHIGVGSFLSGRGRWWLTYRYSHTSNAHLSTPNPGINFHLLHLGHAF